MTDRDHFAAAALTGLLIAGDDGSFSEDSYARAAYCWADVMLRERERTIHDAVPAAIAVSDEDRTDKAATSHRRDRSGNTLIAESANAPPHDAVVRLPALDPNGAPGWNAAIGAVREALAEAGVDWDTE